MIYSNLPFNHSFSLSPSYRSATMMIENRESDERVCCVLSLSLFLSLYYEDTFVFLCFSSRSYEKKTREVTNRRQISPLTSFFFATLLRSFIARTQHALVTHKNTHTYTSACGLGRRKESSSSNNNNNNNNNRNINNSSVEK